MRLRFESDPRRDLDGSLGTLRRRQHPFHREHFDHVADLQVVELVEADAALEPGLDLADVVLEPPERTDFAFVNDGVVAEQSRLGVACAGDAPLADHAARNRAEFWDLEDVAYFGDTDPDLFECRIEQTRHRLL